MTTVKIHQIYYSPESFAALDKGFIPLDNTHGRSDWMEYWPIRQYFLNTPVGDDELVGFFSPRFFEKTGLTATEVHAHIEANPGHDVYLFNPYFHLAALHENVFVQARHSHPGIAQATQDILKIIDIEIELDKIIMSSMNTVFCNYFVANIEFWRKWLMICELIFQICENENASQSHSLNEKTNYIRGAMPMKIFIIERIASLLLGSTNKWKINQKFIFKNLSYQYKKDLPFVELMHHLDALKTSFILTRNPHFLSLYNSQKHELINEYGLFV